MREPLGLPWALAVDSGVQPAFPIFVVPARVDLGNVRDLTSPIKQAVSEGTTHFALDFSTTESIDSTALGALVQIYKGLQAHQGRMVLFGVGDAVRRVLSLTRLDTVFHMAATESEAQSVLSGGASPG